ncbi:MAG: hypothetical protein AAFQ80_21100 [Cyanobacteria bacterium J06621_8]
MSSSWENCALANWLSELRFIEQHQKFCDTPKHYKMGTIAQTKFLSAVILSIPPQKRVIVSI